MSTPFKTCILIFYYWCIHCEQNWWESISVQRLLCKIGDSLQAPPTLNSPNSRVVTILLLVRVSTTSTSQHQYWYCYYLGPRGSEIFYRQSHTRWVVGEWQGLVLSTFCLHLHNLLFDSHLRKQNRDCLGSVNLINFHTNYIWTYWRARLSQVSFSLSLWWQSDK